MRYAIKETRTIYICQTEKEAKDAIKEFKAGNDNEYEYTYKKIK